MATTRKPRIVGDMTTPLTPLEIDLQVQAQADSTARQIAAEARNARKWLRRSRDYVGEALSTELSVVLLCAGCMAVGAVLGFFGQPMLERQTNATALYQAMKTAIPVVSAVEIAVDPGKYVGKLVDVVMTPSRGGLFKSGKGLYVSESEGGLSLTIFESAFPQFLDAYQVARPEDLVSHLIGKYVKARGTIRSVLVQKDSSQRTSMVIYAPGLLSIIPERP